MENMAAGNGFGKQQLVHDNISSISSDHLVLILVYSRPEPSSHLSNRARNASSVLEPAVFGPCPRQTPTPNKPLVSFKPSSHRHGEPSMIGSHSNGTFETWPLLWTMTALSLTTRPINRFAPLGCMVKDFVSLLLPNEAGSSGGDRHLHWPQPLTVDGRCSGHWSHRSRSTASAYRCEKTSCSTQRTRSRSSQNSSAALRQKPRPSNTSNGTIIVVLITSSVKIQMVGHGASTPSGLRSRLPVDIILIETVKRLHQRGLDSQTINDTRVLPRNIITTEFFELQRDLPIFPPPSASSDPTRHLSWNEPARVPPDVETDVDEGSLSALELFCARLGCREYGCKLHGKLAARYFAC
jgi:hypothetical protein